MYLFIYSLMISKYCNNISMWILCKNIFLLLSYNTAHAPHKDPNFPIGLTASNLKHPLVQLSSCANGYAFKTYNYIIYMFYYYFNNNVPMHIIIHTW